MVQGKQIDVPDHLREHKAWKDFVKFHRDNREVMRTIIDQIQIAKDKGVRKTSVKMIINWIRWNVTISNPGKPYKINDKYTGIYTHLIIHNWPEYRDMIESRELRAIKYI